MKYKVLLHWDMFRKYQHREGEIVTEGYTTEQILERIFFENQNEWNKKDVPSISELDIIEFEDGRRFRVLDEGFNELCTKDNDRSCQICAKFFIQREDVPKAIHFNVRNTFYKGKNNLCRKCFKDWGLENQINKNVR